MDMKKNIIVVLLLAVFCVVSFSAHAWFFGLDIKTSTMKKIADNPRAYVGKKVEIAGVLKLEGSYWRGGRFYLTEEYKGKIYKIKVQSWVPLERMRPPPGQKELRKIAPKTMQYYLNKKLKLKGKIIGHFTEDDDYYLKPTEIEVVY